MKVILSAMLVLGLCSVTCAADEKAGPVGTWKCEYDIGGQKREATLAVKKDGDKLTGTMTFQDKQEAKLKDLKLKDGELTFSVERKLMDMTFNVEYRLKVEGDKLKGKGAVDVGGEKRDLLPLQYDAETIGLFRRLRHAFDPDERMNPEKVFPSEGAEDAAAPGGEPAVPRGARPLRGWL